MNPRLVLVPLIVVMLAGGWVPLVMELSGQVTNPRTTVVLGDLHMGVGRDAAGAWHPQEDFRWPAELAAFLDVLGTDGGATDLILNGDTFELWESTGDDCVYLDADLGCTEPEALARLERVLAAHTSEILALGRFAALGSNRLVFVPGDHDAALLFPSVRRRLLSALGAPEGRAEVPASGGWLSDDGRIYVEHGHQVGFSAEHLDGWPRPFVTRGGREHLVRSRGERVATDVGNRLERPYPVIDNIAQAGLGVAYALAAEGADARVEAAPSLLRYVLFKMSYQQFRLTDYSQGQPPVWDLTKVRAEGAAFLVGSLAEDDPFMPIAASALAEGRLSGSMDELTDAELVAICDYQRGAVRRARRRMESLNQFPARGPAVPECPRTQETEGSEFGYFWRTRDLTVLRRLETVTAEMERDGRRILVFVRNHTHLADRSQQLYNQLVPQGFSPIRDAATPIVINGGAWQRTITPLQLDRLKTNRDTTLRDLLGSLGLDELPPCYGFVHIEPYSDTPAPAVQFWRQNGDAPWGLSASCR